MPISVFFLYIYKLYAITLFNLLLKVYSVILTTYFYDMDQKILTQNGFFQNFSWFQFYVYKLSMIMCTGIAP